jgi:TonB family protein
MRHACMVIFTLSAFQIFGMNNISIFKCTLLNNSIQNLDSVYHIHDLDSIPIFSNKIENNIKIAIRNELVKHIDYPQEAIEKEIHGSVHLSFIIKSNGEIDSIKVIRGKDELIDNAAIKGISKLNVTKPGIKNNKPVNTLIYYRVDFNT